MAFQLIKSKLTSKTSCSNVNKDTTKTTMSLSRLDQIIKGELTITVTAANSIKAAKMTRSTIPQYTYTNTECRQWLTRQLQSRACMTKVMAASLANQFEDTGIELFDYNREDWTDIMGWFGLIIRLRIRNILWNKKKAMKAGLSKELMMELRGEVKKIEVEELDLNWEGMYQIK